MDFELLRTQTTDGFIHRIQTDTATTDIGGLFTAAESRSHQKIINLILAQTRSIDWIQDLTLDGGAHHFFAIDTSAVVTQLDMHTVALCGGFDLDLAAGGLAELLAFLDGLNPVVDGIIDKMQENLSEGQHLVLDHLNAGPIEFQVNLLAQSLAGGLFLMDEFGFQTGKVLGLGKVTTTQTLQDLVRLTLAGIIELSAQIAQLVNRDAEIFLADMQAVLLAA